VFRDQISLRVPNLPAYFYKRAYPNRFKSRHCAQFPKFPGKGIRSIRGDPRGALPEQADAKPGRADTTSDLIDIEYNLA
jgi:hypothetical protein